MSTASRTSLTGSLMQCSSKKYAILPQDLHMPEILIIDSFHKFSSAHKDYSEISLLLRSKVFLGKVFLYGGKVQFIGYPPKIFSVDSKMIFQTGTKLANRQT